MYALNTHNVNQEIQEESEVANDIERTNAIAFYIVHDWCGNVDWTPRNPMSSCTTLPFNKRNWFVPTLYAFAYDLLFLNLVFKIIFTILFNFRQPPWIPVHIAKCGKGRHIHVLEDYFENVVVQCIHFTWGSN